MPAAPWMANVLAGRAPGTITVRPPVQGGGLALPVSNIGSRGQDARYYLGNLRRLDNGYYTDGTYTYDPNGLSVDRPNSFVPGLPPADESERWDVWRPPSVGAPSSGPPPTPPPFSNPPLPGLPPFSNPPVYTGPTRPVSPGILPGFGVLPGGVPSAADWVRQPGFYESDVRDPRELLSAPPARYEGAETLATLQRLLRGRVGPVGVGRGGSGSGKSWLPIQKDRGGVPRGRGPYRPAQTRPLTLAEILERSDYYRGL